MLKTFLFLAGLILSISAELDAVSKAKNLVLFLADGGGLPTVNAASIHGYGRPGALYLQRMPHIGLSETSSASSWVTDSAAGMTAIVTGQKTHNGVVSQSATAERGRKDGEPLKTILEYAEERGLSTGVVSNSSMADATPAACYAHANDRSRHGEIFAQVLNPRFGDGVDVIIGSGRESILEQTYALGIELAVQLPKKGFVFLDRLERLHGVQANSGRVVALFEEAFDLAEAVEIAIQILSRNPKGFFLMVESNTHITPPAQDLARMVALDRIVQRTAERLRSNSLILFTADHSHDLRLTKGTKGEDILPLIRSGDGTHTAEEVLATAEGPGADRVHGIFPNTYLFDVMMKAFGW
ncbi:MAG: alkaline phosphatase [Acidimicrobiia bacterium]|nr:alkaline phosphatase [Acidimicrobiia bacterium]